MNAQRGSPIRAPYSAGLVACAGIAVTVAAVLGTRHLEQERAESAFQAQASGPTAEVERALELYKEELQFIRRLYDASKEVERQEFETFVEDVRSRRVAIQALMWVPRVPASRRGEYEAEAATEALPGFRFTERDDAGQIRPAAKRSLYYPVLYLQPDNRDTHLFGLDLGSVPDLQQALAEARVGNRVTATPPLDLFGDSQPEAIVAFVLPVYEHDTPDVADVDLPPRSLMGFVVVALRPYDLIAEALTGTDLGGLRLSIYDESGPGQPTLLGSYPAGAKTAEAGPGAAAEEEAGGQPDRAVDLDLAGRRWRCVCRPTPRYVASARSNAPWLVLAAGLILTGLSAAYVLTITGRAAWADRLVAERTAELSRTNDQLQLEMEERARKEEALRASEENYRLLVQTMNDGLSVLDEDSRMIYVNDALCRTLGYSEEEMLGRTPAELLDENNRKIIQEQLERRRRGESAPYELAWTSKDGRDVYTIVSPRPITEAGHYKGSFAVITDITRLKQTQDELAQTLAELKRSNEQLESFAYVASHDLQEPLRKIVAFGDRLEAKCAPALNARGRDYLDRMQTAATRMQALINGLLTFSRVTTRGQPFVRVHLGQVAREVVSDLETRIEQVNGRVEIGDLPTIDADPLQMRQLLQNLIGNALKFHREDAPPIVTVRGEIVERESGAPGPERVCRLTVEDNGIGFDAKHADRIFGMFQRLHGRSEYEGTGVGLAICRKIAERHGGSLTAHSVPGKGSTFTVTLPARHTEGGQAQ